MVVIRQLKQGDDLADLISLSREFFAEYEAHHDEFFDIDGLEDSHIADYFTCSIGSDDNATFVALQEGRLVGYVTVHVRGQAPFYKVKRVGAISGLMVRGEDRRSGIATQLLDRAKVFFKARGVKYFTVYTAVANDSAVSFYEKNGMVSLHTTLIGEIDG